MPKRSFQTVPDELIAHADAFADYFEHLGYRIGVEESAVEHPYTAAFLARRRQTTVIFEVTGRLKRLDFSRIRDWTQYGRSLRRDTRVCVGVPEVLAMTVGEVEQIKSLGAGLYRSTNDGVMEVTPPLDLSVQVALPGLDSLHKRLRPLLGPAYEQFGRSMWREGFEEACQALEVEARRYLRRGLRTGRLVFVKPTGAPHSWTEQQIERMTAGQLAAAFEAIRTQNHAEATVAKILKQVNPDRVGVVHYKSRAATERRLRENVGRHMYLVIAGLRALLGVK